MIDQHQGQLDLLFSANSMQFESIILKNFLKSLFCQSERPNALLLLLYRNEFPLHWLSLLLKIKQKCLLCNILKGASQGAQQMTSSAHLTAEMVSWHICSCAVFKSNMERKQEERKPRFSKSRKTSLFLWVAKSSPIRGPELCSGRMPSIWSEARDSPQELNSFLVSKYPKSAKELLLNKAEKGEECKELLHGGCSQESNIVANAERSVTCWKIPKQIDLKKDR